MIFDAITKVVAERTGTDQAGLTRESKFADLGIDSLDTVELLMCLEDEIGVEIELDHKLETLGELEDFIAAIQA